MLHVQARIRDVYEACARYHSADRLQLGCGEFSVDGDASSRQSAAPQPCQQPFEQVHARALNNLAAIRKTSFGVWVAKIVFIFRGPPTGDEFAVDSGRVPVGGILFVGTEQNPSRPFSTASETTSVIHHVLVGREHDRRYTEVIDSLLECAGTVLMPLERKSIVSKRSWLEVVWIRHKKPL